MSDMRERDPYPLTWEVPAGIAVLIAVAGVHVIHLGRAIANLTVGAPWAWPPSEHLLNSIPGILSGDASAGLTASPQAAPSWLLLTWIANTLTLASVVSVLVGRWIANRWGPAAVRGTATISQARAVLGVRRLRRHQRVTRPDLTGPSRGKP